MTYLRHCYSDRGLKGTIVNPAYHSFKITSTVSFIIIFSNLYLLSREAKDEISRLSSKDTNKDDLKDINLKAESQEQDDKKDVKEEEDEEMEQDEEDKDMLEDSDGKIKLFKILILSYLFLFGLTFMKKNTINLIWSLMFKTLSFSS